MAKDKDFDVRLEAWRRAVRRVAARRLRHVNNLAKRTEAKIKKKQTEEIRIAFMIQKAATQFLEAAEKSGKITHRRGPGSRSKSPQVTITGSRDVRKLTGPDVVEDIAGGVTGTHGSHKMKLCTILCVVVAFLVFQLSPGATT